jgi:hypothetical protein
VARATPGSLTRKEQALVFETRRDQLRSLDEEALIELLARVRRARDKFVQLHRREVAGQVDEARARGVASAPPRRSASKAEIFEQALARVSSALARAARESAAQLRADRLAASRAASRPAATTPTPQPASLEAPAPRARRRKPIEHKTVAAARAANARQQAKRDAR